MQDNIRCAIIGKMAVRKKISSTKKKGNLETEKFENKDSNQRIFQLLKKPKVFLPLIIIVVGLVLFYARSLFIVAIVNGQPISRISVIGELEKRDGKQTVNSLITQTLILQEAKKRNIDVSAAEIKDMTKQLEDSLKKQGQNLDTALSLQGMTRNDLETQLRIRKLVEKMLAKDVKVTDKEVNDYVEKNKATIPENLKPDEATKAARQQLEQQKLSAKAQSFIQDLQSKAKIQYFVNY